MVDHSRVAHLPAQPGTARYAPVEALFDDLSDLKWDSGDGVHINGQRVSTTTRHLSDLLTAGGERPLHMADRAAADAMVSEGHDPLLYRAVRDVFPPRAITGATVRADLVIYEDDDLPGGEPCRSLGHWNPGRQLEIFQVLRGQVAIFVAGETVGGDRFSYVHDCHPGEVATMPLGIWHASYVLRGPAVVFNVYADLEAPSETPDDDKYRRATPVGITLVRLAGDLCAVSTAEAHRVWGDLMDPPEAEWVADWIQEGSSLPALHRGASVGEWDGLAAALTKAHALGWPASAQLLGPVVR